MNARLRSTLFLIGLTSPLLAQQPAPPGPPARGHWEISGIPALNFNADEGFGYGLIVQAFDYEPGAKRYAYTIQPTLFMTTKGRRDVSLFFDAPTLLPGGWRLTAAVAREQQLATPYYGVGNATPHDTLIELPPNPYYYRYGRVGTRVTTDLQRPLGHSLRGLIGAGTRSSNIDVTPFDSGFTLLTDEGESNRGARVVYLRAGLVYDDRDRETGPTHGTWSEVLVQRTAKRLGGSYAFTRITGTVRHYTSLTSRTVLATRLVGQNLSGPAPFYELFAIQGSFKDDEGLGGSGTLRGWPKNRFAGRGILMIDNEIRFRAAEFSLLGRPAAVVLSAFVDAGAVGARHFREALSALPDDLHVGTGGGVRLRVGQDFVVAVDAGHSKEAHLPIYIGLGYAY